MRNAKGQFAKGHKIRVGMKHSQETLEKFSAIHKGQIAWNRGIPCSKEVKEKLRKFNIGKIIPQKTKNKISKALKGKVCGDANGNWKGGKSINNQGNVFIHSPLHPYCNKMGYVTEHRLLMEKCIKRFLKPKEVVHHINNIHYDNRIENLILFSNGASHTKFHHILRKSLTNSRTEKNPSLLV